MRSAIFLILLSCATGYYAKSSVVKIDKTKNYKIAIIPQLKSNYLNEVLKILQLWKEKKLKKL